MKKEAQTIKNNSSNEVMKIWISYIWTVGWRNKCREDHHSQNMQLTLFSCKKIAWKNSVEACQESNPNLCNTGAAL